MSRSYSKSSPVLSSPRLRSHSPWFVYESSFWTATEVYETSRNHAVGTGNSLPGYIGLPRCVTARRQSFVLVLTGRFWRGSTGQYDCLRVAINNRTIQLAVVINTLAYNGQYATETTNHNCIIVTLKPNFHRAQKYAIHNWNVYADFRSHVN